MPPMVKGNGKNKRARVLFDDHEWGRVYVFAADGQFICIAQDYEHMGVSRPEVIDCRKARQSERMREGKKVLAKMEREARVNEVAGDITADAAKRAGKLSMLPQSTVAYNTPNRLTG